MFRYAGVWGKVVQQTAKKPNTAFVVLEWPSSSAEVEAQLKRFQANAKKVLGDRFIVWPEMESVVSKALRRRFYTQKNITLDKNLTLNAFGEVFTACVKAESMRLMDVLKGEGYNVRLVFQKDLSLGARETMRKIKLMKPKQRRKAQKKKKKQKLRHRVR